MSLKFNLVRANETILNLEVQGTQNLTELHSNLKDFKIKANDCLTKIIVDSKTANGKISLLHHPKKHN